jgi:serine-type D-Ala-D-Ala carboxypeptidase/endopeptidase (penicillin-binding protein 4)
MKKTFFSVAALVVLTTSPFTQSTNEKLQKAFREFETSEQLKHAVTSLYVIDATTGQVIFDKNSQVGLAPASTQKIITSVTALELLGKDYRYKTELCYRGEIRNSVLTGQLLISGYGDPTLGSWRYSTTKEEDIIKKWVSDIKAKGIKKVNGFLAGDGNSGWTSQYTPDGWIWQDIGNYYGAGADDINWRENQYDLILRSGDKQGDKVEVVKTIPEMRNIRFVSEAVAGAKGSGDNAYIYLAPYSDYGLVTGTIPPGEKTFKISGSLPVPRMQMLSQMSEQMKKENISITGSYDTSRARNYFSDKEIISTIYSPTLDSIIYWFNKKSINLYGEALIKTFAHAKTGIGSTDSGVSIVRRFWKEKGLDEDELNIYDGSGLSPLNRVTTHAQVEILKYASSREWFSYFLDALPEYNAMKMKSGTISDVKGFCGYHTAKDGKQYIFSFLVNNYNGRASELVNKMYRVLDCLK